MRRAIGSLLLLSLISATTRADEASAAKLIESSGGQVQRDKGKPGKVLAVALGPKASAAEVKALGEFKNLLALSITGPMASDETAKQVATRKTLVQVLFFDARKLTDNGVKTLATLPNVKQLALSDADGVTSAGIAELAGMKSLTELQFAGGQMGDEELRAFAKCKKLSSLSATGKKAGITDAGLKDLATLANLDSLTVLAGGKVTDAGVKELARMKNLTSLTLVRIAPLTDAALKDFGSMKKLVTLSFEAGPGVTDAGLGELAGLTNLGTLTIGAKALTGTGFRELAGLKLTRLYLNVPRFTNEGLKEVAAIKSLELLQVFNGGEVTDAGVKPLTALPKLASLDLSYCKITDASLKDLAAIKSLTLLTLTNTKVTDAGVAEFRKALPNCKVIR